MLEANIIDSRKKKFVAQILTTYTYISGYNDEKKESIEFVKNRMPNFNFAKEVWISIKDERLIFSQIYKEGFEIIGNFYMYEIENISQKQNWFTLKSSIKFEFKDRSTLNLLLLGTSDSTGGVILEVGKYLNNIDSK